MRSLLTLLLLAFLLLTTGLTHVADIPFTLDKPGNVSAAIYDSQGSLVRELLHAAVERRQAIDHLGRAGSRWQRIARLRLHLEALADTWAEGDLPHEPSLELPARR